MHHGPLQRLLEGRPIVVLLHKRTVISVPAVHTDAVAANVCAVLLEAPVVPPRTVRAVQVPARVIRFLSQSAANRVQPRRAVEFPSDVFGGSEDDAAIAQNSPNLTLRR